MSVTLLVGLFVVCVYRAVTQSITHDEALTWRLFIASPWGTMFHVFDANHHFLNTLLMRLSTGLFGVSEWSMRAPALLGAGLYFCAVYRLARAAFGPGLTSVLVVALLSLNPIVLDFMVAARGYGMGLGLWMWALASLHGALSEPPPAAKDLVVAGAALALSVTANLIYAPPAVALGGIALWLANRRAASGPSPRWPWIGFVGAFVAVAALFLLAAPIGRMRVEHFYAGTPTMVESARSLAIASLEQFGPFRSAVVPLRDVVALGLAPVIVLAGVAVALLRRDLLATLVAGSAVSSVLMLWAAHLVLDRPYPDDRTGLYFVPMVSLLLVSVTRHGLAHRGIARGGGVLACGLAVCAAAHFATELDTHKFWIWRYDADTRAMGEYMARHRPPAAPPRHVRVGGSWHLQETLGFYKSLNKWDWMELWREKRERPDTPVSGLEWYAFAPWDREQIDGLGLREVYRGRVSGSALGVPRVFEKAPAPPAQGATSGGS